MNCCAQCRGNQMAYYVRRGRRRGTLRGLGQSTAGLPGGSRLSYSAVWNNPGVTSVGRVGWNDPNGVQAAIQPILSQVYGVIIDGQSHQTSDIINFTGKSGFTLQLHTISDRDKASDVQSIIDGAIYNLLGVMPQSQIIVITVAGDPYATLPGAGLAPKPPTDLGQWLSDNWPWLALGVGVLVAAEDVL